MTMDDELAPLLGWALMADPMVLLMFLCTLKGAHLGNQRQQLIDALKRFNEDAIMVMTAEQIAASASKRREEGDGD